MRLPPLRPEQLSDAQRVVYQQFRTMAESDQETGFETIHPDGTLLGPWSVLLHFPDLAPGLQRFIEGITAMTSVSESAKQVVILTVAGRFNAAYELYAHSSAAARAGLDINQITALSSGVRPAGLTTEQALVADLTTAVLNGGVVPAPVYDAVVAQLGRPALDSVVFLTMQYVLVGALLNTYDVPPGEPTSWIADASALPANGSA